MSSETHITDNINLPLDIINVFCVHVYSLRGTGMQCMFAA